MGRCQLHHAHTQAPGIPRLLPRLKFGDRTRIVVSIGYGRWLWRMCKKVPILTILILGVCFTECVLALSWWRKPLFFVQQRRADNASFARSCCCQKKPKKLCNNGLSIFRNFVMVITFQTPPDKEKQSHLWFLCWN